MSGEADKRRFLEQGYLVIEGVVPETLCASVRRAICDFTGVIEDDPASWRRHDVQGHGIVPVHHAQALWDVRQLPQLHRIFAMLYGTEQLWVSVDRASCKLPAQQFDTGYRVDPIHWDGDPRQLASLSIQGLVYLADTAAEQGGFCCVPTLYRELDAWLAHHADDPPPLQPDVTGHAVLRIGAPAGSLIVWNRRMPHSSGENRCERPRWVQYLTMTPAGNEQARAEQRALYLEKRPPAWAVRQQIAGQQIPEPGAPAMLTALGRKLAGVDPW